MRELMADEKSHLEHLYHFVQMMEEKTAGEIPERYFWDRGRLQGFAYFYLERGSAFNTLKNHLITFSRYLEEVSRSRSVSDEKDLGMLHRSINWLKAENRRLVDLCHKAQTVEGGLEALRFRKEYIETDQLQFLYFILNDECQEVAGRNKGKEKWHYEDTEEWMWYYIVLMSFTPLGQRPEWLAGVLRDKVVTTEIDGKEVFIIRPTRHEKSVRKHDVVLPGMGTQMMAVHIEYVIRSREKEGKHSRTIWIDRRGNAPTKFTIAKWITLVCALILPDIHITSIAFRKKTSTMSCSTIAFKLGQNMSSEVFQDSIALMILRECIPVEVGFEILVLGKIILH
jgi:hypothetical protein